MQTELPHAKRSCHREPRDLPENSKAHLPEKLVHRQGASTKGGCEVKAQKAYRVQGEPEIRDGKRKGRQMEGRVK